MTLSEQTDADPTQYLDTIKGLGIDSNLLTFAHYFSIDYMNYKLGVANTTLRKVCIEGGMDPENVSVSAFEMLDGCGKLVVCVGVVMAVVDAIMDIMDIIDIVDVVAQTKKLEDALRGNFKLAI